MRKQRRLRGFGRLVWIAAAITVIFLGRAMQSRAKNVATVGRVHISLKEEETGTNNELQVFRKQKDDGKEDEEESGREGERIRYLQPGELVYKRAEIKVEKGSGTAYLRVKLVVCGGTAAQQKDLLENIETDHDWYYQEEDGYFYYQKALQEGDKVVFLAAVHVPEQWSALEDVLCFRLNMVAEAAQDEYLHLEMARGNVYGWG